MSRLNHANLSPASSPHLPGMSRRVLQGYLVSVSSRNHYVGETASAQCIANWTRRNCGSVQSDKNEKAGNLRAKPCNSRYHQRLASLLTMSKIRFSPQSRGRLCKQPAHRQKLDCFSARLTLNRNFKYTSLSARPASHSLPLGGAVSLALLHQMRR